MTTAHQRKQYIVDYLARNKSVSIQELAEMVSVSTMTIHRDLDKLVDEGVVLKTHGGATLQPSTAPEPTQNETCPMCRQTVREQLTFTLQFDEKSKKQACCPHCGLMMLNMQNPALILATDFLHNSKVNALQATYLVKSDLKTCCSPSVLSFASADDAKRFQQGFGGEMMSFSETQAFLNHTHKLPK